MQQLFRKSLLNPWVNNCCQVIEWWQRRTMRRIQFIHSFSQSWGKINVPTGKDLILTSATPGQCSSSTRNWFSKSRVYCYSEIFILKDNSFNVIAYKLQIVSIFCRFLFCEAKLRLVDLIIIVENIGSFPYNLPGRMPIRFSSALQTHSSSVGHDFIKLFWKFLPGLHETNCRCESVCFSLLYTTDCHPYKPQSVVSSI